MRARAAEALGIAVVLAAMAWAAAAAAGRGEALPAGYRGWSHVRSIAVRDPDHAMYGFHDGYADDAAIRGLRSRPVRFEDGATFVVSIYEISTRGGITTAGAKRRTVVQVKDRKATETGGWRFAAFDPSGKPVPIDEGTCFGCHSEAKDTDSVLTSFRE
jgi:hypothetical protein